MKKYALVLAAGKGTRMKTEVPKCAFPILKKPMICYILENLENSYVDEVGVVVGYKKEHLIDILKDRVFYVEQEEQLGTGHAVLQAKNYLENKEGITFIMPGDMPLIQTNLINKVIDSHLEMGNDLTVVSMVVDYPKGYGRIVRNEFDQIVGIVEENDCDSYQKLIKEVNTGIYIVNNQKLFEALTQVKNNERKGEYYLTDIVEIMHVKHKVNSFKVRYPHVTMGVNDLYGLSIAEKYLRDDINKVHMLNGVSILNPETVTIGDDVIIEAQATIMPNTTVTGKTLIKSGAIVGPNTEVHNSTIGQYVKVQHSLVYDSIVDDYTTIGPFAHLRAHAHVGEHNRIGNFVEIKNSKTGYNTKASHLSYIGDAEVGKNVNFGCGSVTVNYDGVYKHKTVIGDDVFIGCNVNLVAPINVANRVFIAAGSTVIRDIPEGVLAVERGQQIHKEDYYNHLIKPKKEEKK